MGIYWDHPSPAPWICLTCRKPFWSTRKYKKHVKKDHA